MSEICMIKFNIGKKIDVQLHIYFPIKLETSSACTGADNNHEILQ